MTKSIEPSNHNIVSYLDSKGWEYKLKNDEYWTECPFCEASADHFSINGKTELFKCFKCGEKGHLLSLKKRLGDLPPISHISQYSKPSKPEKTIDISLIEKYQKDLQESAWAMAYLNEERGLTPETINKFRLGLRRSDSSISIAYFKDGVCLNIKYRLLDPKAKDKYIREPDCRSILFNLDNAQKCQSDANECLEIIITEGELDAIAFDQMGFPVVVAVPVGADTFSDEWIDDLEQFDKIYLSYDMDEKGRKGVEKTADKLGRYRCHNVLLPLKDANECLKAGFTYPEMAEILARAKPFDLPIIKPPEAFYEEIRAKHEGRIESKGIPTGWNSLDTIIGGVRKQELTIITGETGGGKSTWATNLSFRFAQKNHPVLIASFEMSPGPILQKMIATKTGRPVEQLSKKELDSSFEYIATLPIWFIDCYGEIGLAELKEAIFYAKRRHGIELVLLDHLHFFLKFQPDFERQTIDSAMKEIKVWAMTLGVHILLIVHPTKLPNDSKIVSLNDLKGSSGLKQITDNVFSLWRDRTPKNPPQATDQVILFILKVRSDSGDEGSISFTFDKKSQSYSEVSGLGEASPTEGMGTPASSPRSRPDRSWVNGYEQ